MQAKNNYSRKRTAQDAGIAFDQNTKGTDKRIRVDYHLKQKFDEENFQRHKSIVIGSLGKQKASEKIAAFDMDWTLIKTKSGRTFPIDANDWDWWDTEVLPKLKQLDADGFRVIIFTNQGGVSSGKRPIE